MQALEAADESGPNPTQMQRQRSANVSDREQRAEIQTGSQHKRVHQSESKMEGEQLGKPKGTVPVELANGKGGA